MAEDELVAHYRSLKPLRFDEVERFDLRYPANPVEGEPRSILTIVLRSNPHNRPGWKPGHQEPGQPKLVLTLYGIEKLEMAARSYWQLIQLEIASIRDRQWCDLHYEVHEEENQDLSFYCDTFDAALISEGDEEPSE